MLVIKNLTKKFGSKTVLNNISLSVDHGEIALLMGRSGVGKSTLLRVLNNLEVPDSGSIMLDGKLLDIKTVHKTHTIGMVFQQFNLFEHLTTIENITIVLEKVLKKPKKEAEKIAHELLKKYGLDDKAHAPISALSGGQKQRLALARTLSLQPKVICLDEPTSALDPLLTTYIAETIQELARQNYIVLVSSHDTLLVEKLTCTIYLMENGTIIESAHSKEFQKHPDNYPKIKRFIAGVQE